MTDSCRLCAAEVQINDLVDLQEDFVQDKLLKCSLYLDDNKLFPQNICTACIDVIDNFSKFLDNVALVQDHFSQLLVETLGNVGDVVKSELEIEFLQVCDETPNIQSSKVSGKSQSVVKRTIVIKDPIIKDPVKRKRTPRKKQSQIGKEQESLSPEKIFEDEINGQFLRKIDTLNVFDHELNSDGTLNELAQNRLEEFNWANQNWKCGKCEEIIDDPEKLTEHCKQIHESVAHYKCEECGYTTIVKSRFISHLIGHKPFLKFCCQICSHFSPDCIQLYYHKKLEHPNHKCFHCFYCGHLFSSGSSLSLHKTTHQPNYLRNNLICDLCGEKCKIKKNMEVHFMRKHLIVPKPHICEICGRDFLLKESLTKHLMSHSDFRPYQCPTCGRGFKDRKELKKHNLIHLDLRPHSCQVCGKTFRHKNSMRSHMRTHSDEMPYQCDFCVKKFKFYSSITAHKRAVHTGVRPYGCEICNTSTYTFADHSNYSKHMKGHHGINISKKINRIEIKMVGNENEPTTSSYKTGEF